MTNLNPDDILATGIKVWAWNDIEYFKFRVTEKKHLLQRGNQELQRKKIVKIIRKFQNKGLIKSVKKPKNKNMQKQINELVKAKRTIDKTIEIIKTLYPG